MLGGEADGVLSDMAAPTTGHRNTDYYRTAALFEEGLHFAMDVLKPGGFYLGKAFRGGAENMILSDMKQSFEQVKHIKPKASRAESVELYVLATGFRGKSATANREDDENDT
jgi:23S rRNA (uridine2552-2'-O)-methyltransferase